MTRLLIEFALGLLLTVVTLGDVFSTILVPGPSRTRLKAATRVRQLALPLALWFARRGRRHPGGRPSNSLAPTLFVFASASWLLLLLLGFALMVHAMRAWFAPPLNNFAQAFYVAGSAVATLGLSEVDALGPARWLLLFAAFAGFGVVTATISFMLQVQGGLGRREPMVLALATVAGTPPSGMAILEEHARLSLQAALPRFFHAWSDWAAAVMHSHISYPVLAYFHSADGKGDWLAALEAVMDAASLVAANLEGEVAGAAALTHRMGVTAIDELGKVFDLGKSEASRPCDAGEARRRLAAAGYPLRGSDEDGAAALARLRRAYAGRLHALAAHLGANRAA